MYLVITTGIWMNKTSSRSHNVRNVPFGVFGVMLPYKTVRSTHFSNFCVFIMITVILRNCLRLFLGKIGYGCMLYY
jgi:hypothetical protein